MRRLIVDTHNLLFRTFAVQKHKEQRAGDPDLGLSLHISLNSLKNHFNKIKPDQMVLAFEGRDNWRKEYTKSEKCVSGKVYKANRVRDPSMEPFFDLVRNFEEMIREHTCIPCVQHPRLEGDDIIAAYSQRFSALGDEVYILSADKDFTQLLALPNVLLINPDDGKPRFHEDPKYFMFEKCIRGDSGDNVASAYPRVRTTKIVEAYKDEYAYSNILNSTWTGPDPSNPEVTKEFKVGELVEENRLLMDLTAQPEEVRELMKSALEEGLNSHGKFSYFHFVRFLGKYKLDSIADAATTFVPMLSGNRDKSVQTEKKSMVKF